MRECVFCDVAAGRIKAARLWESDDVVAFLDCDPIREGHALIVPRAHIEDYVDLPPRVSTQILTVGQRLGQRRKALYGVERVALLYAGSDVPHAHAHVFPMHEKADVTSARYIVRPREVVYDSSHLQTDLSALELVAQDLRLE